MEKQYLVVHMYDNISPAVYIADVNFLPNLMVEIERCKKFCFEFDFEKIKNALVEVELKIVPTAKSNG